MNELEEIDVIEHIEILINNLKRKRTQLTDKYNEDVYLIDCKISELQKEKSELENIIMV